MVRPEYKARPPSHSQSGRQVEFVGIRHLKELGPIDSNSSNRALRFQENPNAPGFL